MSITKQLAKHFKEVYFGGNWTASNFKDTITGISLEQAKATHKNSNTILALCYHIHYYVKGTLDVFNGGDLEIRDKYSFNHPEITSETGWNSFKQNLWKEAREFIIHIEALEDSVLTTSFVDEKYGSYYRNISGITEHTHYHLGQIALLKKILIK